MTVKKKIRVLIVEDEVLTANSLKMDLEELGIEALAPVARGEDAVQVSLKENPSLILMDVSLAGGMDGVEAAEKILRHRDIPIVFMTGFARNQIKLPPIKGNLFGFLEKPIDVDAIVQIIESLRQKKENLK